MSEKNSLARKAYWERMTIEEKAQRMSSIAKKKQKNLTFKQKRDHAMKMVNARTKRLPKSSIVL